MGHLTEVAVICELRRKGFSLQGVRKVMRFLDRELGTTDISVAQSYLEDPLRLLLHLIMSQPEYQLG